MILTAVGYLLLFLFGLSVCLFCWLTYASLSGAARQPGKASQDRFLERATHDISGPIGAG